MNIQLLNYIEVDDQGNEWTLNDFSFGKVNLVVGKNSTGKSRILNVIASLGSVLSGEKKINRGDFVAQFADDGKNIIYSLNHSSGKVTKESLSIDGEKLLDRGESGEGTIFAEQLNDHMKFQVPDDVVACVARRDSIQHSYFEPLYNWGKSIRHYYFGSQLGKDQFAVFIKDEVSQDLDAKDTNKVVAFLKRALEKFGDEFEQLVLKDMNSIGYELTSIGVGPMTNISISGGPSKHPDGLYVLEKSHSHEVNQTEMSQGLFRALSLFIQLRYSEKFCSTGLLIIDDVGEGLDYERSTALIKSIIDISLNSNIQLIMSTNDRFVMNNVPLEYWCIVSRDGGDCTVQNYRNSQELFDDFDFTGLSNFDFFSSKYYARNNVES